MKIEPAYVSFEQAKLLKEKRFDELCSFHYSYGNGDKTIPNDGSLYIGGFVDDNSNLRPYKNSELAKWDLPFGEFSAPEQWQVIEWLRINHGIWVYSYTNGKIWYACIQHAFGDMVELPSRLGEHNSPQEAYSAAFSYILSKLI
jgi:hypothetical protein